LAIPCLEQSVHPATGSHAEPQDDGQGQGRHQGALGPAQEPGGLTLLAELADRFADSAAEPFGNHLPVDALELRIRVQDAEQEPVLGEHQARDGGLPDLEGVHRHARVGSHPDDAVRDLPGPPFGGIRSGPADLKKGVPVDDDRRGRLGIVHCTGGLRRGRQAARQRREGEENRADGPKH
jgi:hypothetical protein